MKGSIVFALHLLLYIYQLKRSIPVKLRSVRQQTLFHALCLYLTRLR